MRHAGAVAAAQKAGNPERVLFNLVHTARHTGGALTQQNSSISNLIQLDPRAGAELEKLRDTVSPRSSWQYAPPGPARGRTPSHLAQTVLVALTHSRNHCSAAQDAADDAEQLTFEVSHLTSHLDEAHSHQAKFIGAVAEFFPAVAAELGALAALADVGSIVKPAAAAGRSAALALTDFRCACGEPKVPGGLCPECDPAAASEAYQRGAAEVRKRWRAGLLYDDDGQGDDGWRRAAYAGTTARGY